MALEIRSIPVLTGKTAERFVREAEENARNPKPWQPTLFTMEEFYAMEKRSRMIAEQRRKNGTF